MAIDDANGLDLNEDNYCVIVDGFEHDPNIKDTGDGCQDVGG